MKQEPFFWLTNLSNTNISLSDLNVTIKAFTSINLLDKKHYKYTLEQLQKSSQTGSIAKRGKKLVVRKIPPQIIQDQLQVVSEANMPTRGKSILIIKEENYEELQISDEEFAKENAETADLDTKKLIISS